MRKLIAWTPAEVSSIYWLEIWGLKNSEILQLTKDILTNRSYGAITTMCNEVRRQISLMKGYELATQPEKNTAGLVREASKLDPHEKIKDLKPADLSKVTFIPINIITAENAKNSHKPNKPNFEQVESNPPRPKIVDNEDDSTSVFVKNTPEQKEKISKLVDQAKLPHVPNFAGKAISSLKEPDIEQRVFGPDSTEELLKHVDEGRGHYRGPSLEDVLKAAKVAGASKVCYKDYIIKFS